MKKLFFLILFFSINILTFGANVYFLNDGSEYISTNGQTFTSDASGRALIHYHVWADPTRYSVSEWGARFQDPNGNWSDWSALSSGHGLHRSLKAGTWHVQGRVFVKLDYQTYQKNFYMYTSFTLYCYIVDNYAPTAPQNLAVTQGSNNHPQLTWNANTEYDLDFYEVWRKVHETGDVWQSIGTTTSTSFVDGDYIYAPSGNFGLSYKIRAKDINGNYSSFSSEVTARGEDINKKSTLASIPFDNILYQNYPNPFNPTTKISYSIEESGLVNMKVYDMLGNEVAELVNEEKEAGVHSIVFNGDKLVSGIYIYKIIYKNRVESKRMILMK